MDNRQNLLLDEVSQLFSQYRSEVPGRHRAWPESVKSRVAELHRTGMKYSQIARRTGLPYYTILGWRNEARTGFRMMKVVEEKSASVAVAKNQAAVATATVAKNETVSVHFVSGARIDGVSVDVLKELLPILMGR